MPNETLKTITNAVRVGLVRRRSISPETSDIPSSSIVQQPPNQRLVRKQVCRSRMNSERMEATFLMIFILTPWFVDDFSVSTDELVVVHLYGIYPKIS